MGKKRLAPHEESKVWCKNGKEMFLITKKQDGFFYLYKVISDGYEEVPNAGKTTNPRDFDKVIWPAK